MKINATVTKLQHSTEQPNAATVKAVGNDLFIVFQVKKSEAHAYQQGQKVTVNITPN